MNHYQQAGLSTFYRLLTLFINYLLMFRKFKELFDIYTKLPYIVYRNKFLIPQAPARLHTNIKFIGLKNNIKGSFANHLPQKINPQFIERLNDPSQKDALVKEYKQEMQVKVEEAKRLKEQYHAKYIEPLKAVNFPSPSLVYYRGNKEAFYLYLRQKKKSFNLGEVENFYRIQSEAVRAVYKAKAQAQRAEKAKSYQQMVAEYAIPDIKKYPPNVYYNKLKKEADVEMPPYKDLDKEEKKKYRDICREIKKEKQQQFMDFLSKRNLTIEEFNNIKNICIKVNQAKEALRKAKKQEMMIKTKNQEDWEQDEDDVYEELVQHQVQKDNEGGERVKRKILAQQQLAQFDPKEIPAIKESNTKYPQRSVNKQEDNIDMEEEQMTVDELRRRAARQNKANPQKQKKIDEYEIDQSLFNYTANSRKEPLKKEENLDFEDDEQEMSIYEMKELANIIKKRADEG